MEACRFGIERVSRKPCGVPAASIVRATAPELRHRHGDLSTAQVPNGEYAYTCFSPINYDMPAGELATAWSYGSAGCVSKPWVQMVSCLFPANETTLLTIHDFRIPVTPASCEGNGDAPPEPVDYPLREWVHEDSLPGVLLAIGFNQVILKTEPRMILVIVKGKWGGVAQDVESAASRVYRFDLCPPSPKFINPSMALEAGWLTPNVKKAGEGRFWCPCHQV